MWELRAENCYAKLMSPNKDETAANDCQCHGNMAVRMHQVLARPWVGVRLSLTSKFSLII